MGGVKSKAVVNRTAKIINEVAVAASVRCQTNVAQSQDVLHVNTGFQLFNRINIRQASKVSSSCTMDADFQTKLANDVAAAIANSADAQETALLSAFGNSGAEAQTNLATELRNRISMSSVMETCNAVEQSQTLASVNEYVQFFNSLSAVQGSEIFGAAYLKAVSDAGILNKISDSVDNSATTTSTNPLQFVADMFDAMTSTARYVIIAVIVVVATVILGTLVFVFKFVDSGGLDKAVEASNKLDVSKFKRGP